MGIIITMIVVSIAFFWIDWFVINYAWVNLYDNLFRISENLLLPILFLITVFGVILTFMILKKLKRSGKIYTFKSLFTILVLILVIILHSIPIYSFSSEGDQITNVTNIVSKEIIKSNEYYLYIKNIRDGNLIQIKCNEDIYTDVIIDENLFYTMQYRLNLFDRKSGVLEEINLKDFIDRRNIK
ncbi:MAG: hypothetical protein QM689_10200 [Oscillospiraceae bacterium]